MAQAVQKICCACGQDISGKPRVKDAEGSYYCQPCFKAFQPTPAPPAPAPQRLPPAAGAAACPKCGASVEATAAFCARCGTHLPKGAVFDDNIKWNEIVLHLREYGGASALVMGIEAGAAKMDQAVRNGTADRAKVFEIIEEWSPKEREAREKADRAAEALRRFKREDVVAIRDRVLANEHVDQPTKEALVADMLNVFGARSASEASGASVPVDAAASISATTSLPEKIEYQRESR